MSESSISLVPVSDTNRRRYSVEFKRNVVRESMAAGASIARVAMAHGLNANQLHNWRWQYRRGDFGSVTETAALLPVHISAQPTTPHAHHTTRSPTNDCDPQRGQIELHLGHAKIVVHGTPDLRALQCMIQMLRA